MPNESDYLVRNNKRIAEYLTDLYKGKCIISAHFGENNASFLTAILEVDVKKNVLKLDTAPSELLNKQLLSSAKILFRTEIHGIKVSFSGKNIKKTSTADSTAFEMPLPTAIFWMQRRQFYRVKVPLAHSGSHCKILFRSETESTDSPESIRTGKFTITDLGITGFAFLNPDPSYSMHFAEGKSFNECCLYLHESSHSDISFTIKNITTAKLSSTSNQQRIGCLFTDVSPAFQSGIQRYMQDIERQQKNIA